jgi:predicted metalloprotease with PDZ domain
MRYSNAIGFLAAIVLLLVPFAATANMAPPELPFTLGITGKMNGDGLQLTSVAKGSRAEEAGLKIGDVILAAGRRYAKSMTEAELSKFVEGPHLRRAELVVLRGGRDVLVIEVRG